MKHTFILAALVTFVAGTTFAGGDTEADRDGFSRIAVRGEFTGVLNTTAADVVIESGSDYSVRARGDSRALSYLEFDVEDGDLRIRNPWRPWRIRSLFALNEIRRIVVEVTLPQLESVRLTGSGDARVVDEIQPRRLELRTTGPGNIRVEADTRTLDISITGSGDIEFDGRADFAEIRLTGPGDLHLSLDAETVEATVTGSGDIFADGTADMLDLSLSGPGDFDGEGFQTKEAIVSITGSGDVTVDVDDSLEARLTGPGDLVLGGSPSVVNASTTGSGRVVSAR